MNHFFERLHKALEALPPSNLYRSGGCDAVALGISDFVQKHTSYKPVYVIIARVTYSSEGEELDTNDCSHVVVGFKEHGGDISDKELLANTFDADGGNAYYEWENNWFDDPDDDQNPETYFSWSFVNNEHDLMSYLYRGPRPIKDIKYNPLLRVQVFQYLEKILGAEYAPKADGLAPV